MLPSGQFLRGLGHIKRRRYEGHMEPTYDDRINQREQ